MLPDPHCLFLCLSPPHYPALSPNSSSPAHTSLVMHIPAHTFPSLPGQALGMTADDLLAVPTPANGLLYAP